MSEQYFWRDTVNILGADIGKKGNPSHISVFAIVDEKISDTENKESLVQIHQRFLDGWPYIRQVDYFNGCVEWFGVQRGYVDNTRGELEERNLTREVMPITLGLRDGPVAKGKMKLATQLSLLVEQNRIRLLDDDRFLSQILCVSNELQAPNTPQGHGDAFISVMLAVGVYFDFYAPDRRKGTFNLGNIQELIDLDSKPSAAKMMDDKNSDKCKICGGRNYEQSSDGLNKICQKCLTIW